MNINRFKKTDWHCPNCGSQDIWVHEDGGDYYLGEQYFCSRCGTVHYLDGSTKRAAANALDICEQLVKKYDKNK